MSCESRRCQTRRAGLSVPTQGNSSHLSAENALKASLDRLEQGQMPSLLELMSILSNVSDYTYVAKARESE